MAYTNQFFIVHPAPKPYTPVKKRKVEPSVKVQVVAHEGRDPNAKKDCAVRALATFFNLPYSEALSQITARTNYRVKVGTDVREFDAILTSHGLTYTPARIRLTSKTAKDRLPKKAILLFRAHVCAYEDGTIYDSWYCTDQAGTKQIMGYWSVA